MKGKEVIAQVGGERAGNPCFIKWWKKEDDFVDFDLIDSFVKTVGPEDNLDGFELLDLDQMWEVFTTLNPDCLERVRKGGDEMIQWTWVDKRGVERVSLYPYTPEGLKTLIDADFFA